MEKNSNLFFYARKAKQVFFQRFLKRTTLFYPPYLAFIPPHFLKHYPFTPSKPLGIDLEQLYREHRFNRIWELPLTKDSLDKVTAAFQTWTTQNALHRSNEAWGAYTTSERISNLILFACQTLPFSEAKAALLPFSEALKTSGEWLLSHLEFYGDEVGNHILCDAKGLYICGAFLDIALFRDVGKALLYNELQDLISPRGFLREGSSHYQWLVTKWMLEIETLAKHTHDRPLLDWLAPILIQMKRACTLFLLESKEIPLIGDISPDYSPQHLLQFPYFQEMLAPTTPPGFIHFPEEGWTRFDGFGWTLFWHTEPYGSSEFSTHGHEDTGSFCAYFEGRPVLIDPGRTDYTPASSLHCRAEAHTMVTLDGHAPFLTSRFLPFEYRKDPVMVTIKTSPKEGCWTVSHRGFSRKIRTVSTYTREVHIQPHTLDIVDRFEGRGTHTICSYFQIESTLEPGSDYTEASGQLTLHTPFGALVISDFDPQQDSVTFHTQEETGLGWRSQAYGHRTPSGSIKLTKKRKLPYTQEASLIIRTS